MRRYQRGEIETPSRITLIAPALVSFEAQSLRSHPFYFFVECLNFPFEPSVLRLRCVAAAHFFEGFLDGEFVDFSHCPPHLKTKRPTA
jgi:hypothetical protein